MMINPHTGQPADEEFERNFLASKAQWDAVHSPDPVPVPEAAPANYYDAPYITMINSGQFWRCPHGVTRFVEGGCGKCGAKRPFKFARHWLHSFSVKQFG